jgi:diaminopimelate decarboxylase
VFRGNVRQFVLKAGVMSGFRRDAQGRATLGGAALSKLLASSALQTPAYFYDLDAMQALARKLVAAFAGRPGLVAYAVKANTAGSVVRTLAEAGAGADVVSGGELEVAIGAGIAPASIVMSGVAKADWELDLAIELGIHAIQLESIEEAGRVAARARSLGKAARVSLRINPGVELDSHAHIATGHDEAKFGVPRADVAAAWAAIDAAGGALVPVGVSTHVGSMMRDPQPYLTAARTVAEAARARREAGKQVEFVDFGGGFGIDYGGSACDDPPAFVSAALALLDELELADHQLLVEPGRALVGPYGVLVARVIQSKLCDERRWIMIDAGMNDLIRPALYAAKHRIEPLQEPPAEPSWRVVGPVCESSDDFGAHPMGETPPGAVVIRDAGAYGFTMASEYNGRPLPSEVFLSGGAIVKVSPGGTRASWVKRRLDA